jgi:outer membrane protein TolC
MTCSWRWFIHPATAISRNRNGSRALDISLAHYRQHYSRAGKSRREYKQIRFPDHTGLTQPLFAGGGLRNNLRYAKSQERQAVITYQQTIQRAFGDVSDALIGYDKYHAVRERQEQTVRYRGGTANYLDALDSQRSLFQAELTLAQVRNNEYQSLVQLYKALGGGWK